jgi:hypothetical protein
LSARALESTFEITQTLLLDYHVDNSDLTELNDNYADIRNRLNLNLSADDLTLSMRFDTATFIRSPGSAVPPYLDRYGLEKISARYLGKSFQLSLGDFYASFGRGIALRISKVDELGQDMTLLGVKTRVQTDLVRLTALAGLSNPTNNDGVYEKTLADPYDLVTGLQTIWYLPNTTRLWLHGVGIFFDPLDLNDQSHSLPKQAFSAGAGFEAPDLLDWGNLYAEFDWLGKQFESVVSSDEQLDISHGYAVYLGWNLFLHDCSVLVEFKSYDEYDLYTWTSSDGRKHYNERIDYIRPPTLEPLEMEIANNRDVTGAKIRMDWRPGGADTLLFASFAGFVAGDMSAGDRGIYHVRLGAEQNFLRRGRAKLAVGVREEQPDYAGAEYRGLFYVKSSLKIPLGMRHGLDIHGFNWWADHHNALSDAKYLKGEWTLGYSWAPLLGLAVILGYDTELSGSRSLETFYTTQDGKELRQVFLAGSLNINLLNSGLVFRVLAGHIRGGIKCVAGGCRFIPPFSGVRVEAVIRL